MLLLLVDALILTAVLLAVFLVARNTIRGYKKTQIEQALFRQKVAEDVANQVDRLNPEQILEHEKKVQEKLDKLH